MCKPSIARALLASAAMAPLFAQLTADQKVTDFQTVAALYAKRYGPANWKQEALGISTFELKPWMDRVRASKDDLEYFRICAEFVARLQDGHASYRIPSSFSADLGIFTDLYDGKLLVESIDRTRYPADAYPFQVGDEVVSVGGQPVEEIITDLMKQRGYGNLRGSRRVAADSVTFRPQVFYAHAVDLPDETDVVIRRAESGELQTFRLTWTKVGVPLRQVSPVPSPVFKTGGQDLPAEIGVEDPEKTFRELKTWALDQREIEMRESRHHVNDSGQDVSRNFILGWGARAPYYNPPAGFVNRRGASPADTFFTGTYTSGGKRIGWIRIPNFSPSNPIAAVNEFSTEIAFMKANTDALVVDITRNTGGGCVGLDYAQRLIPNDFYFFGEYLRPTQSIINSYESTLRQLRAARADQWVLDSWAFMLKQLQDAAKENRAMTGALPSCAPVISNTFPVPSMDQRALRDATGATVAYDKPIVFLADELSVSFGDIFPAMMQDNRRGPVVGVRTAGAGGSVTGWPVGFYSEALSSVTNSLVIRNAPVNVPGWPSAPYIENLGVLPDIPLDYMTRDNLMTRGRDFTDAVTRIVLEQLQ